MASKPRDFQADVPVLVTSRSVLRLNYMEDDRVRTELKRWIAWFAPICGVRVFFLVIMQNHVHMILSQRFTGQDRKRKTGISAFLRDVFSCVALYANGLFTLQGRAFERTYLSKNRVDPEQVLQSLVYASTNPLKHDAADDPGEYPESSFPVYVEAEPDGCVTDVLGVLALVAKNPEGRGAAIRQLIQEMYGAPDWEAKPLEVAQQAYRRHPELLDRDGVRLSVPIALWVGETAARWARYERLAAPRFYAERKLRPAPRLEDLIGPVVESKTKPRRRVWYGDGDTS